MKKILQYQQFYYELWYIYLNWSVKRKGYATMKQAFTCTKAHVKNLIKKFDKYKYEDNARHRRTISDLRLRPLR